MVDEHASGRPYGWRHWPDGLMACTCTHSPRLGLVGLDSYGWARIWFLRYMRFSQDYWLDYIMFD